MSEGSWGGGIWEAADLTAPMAIRVAATLRLADHITAGVRTAEDLAVRTQSDPDALARVLARLVTIGVFARTPDGFAVTDLGQHLREDHPDGIRRWLDLEGSVGRADLCFTEMLHTVRTGEAAFPRRFGLPFWEDLSAEPVRAASFDALMGGRLTADAPTVARAYDWGALGHLVDVGGGNGVLLLAILQAHGGLRGTVIDLPGPVAAARELFRSAEVQDRAEALAGSGFDPLPEGAGGYLLSAVLHNWADDNAMRILRRCRGAMPADGRVFVLEDSVGDADGPNTEGDLRMLCYFLGRDRTVAQLVELAEQADLALESVTAAGSRSLLTFRVAAA